MIAIAYRRFYYIAESSLIKGHAWLILIYYLEKLQRKGVSVNILVLEHCFNGSIDIKVKQQKAVLGLCLFEGRK